MAEALPEPFAQRKALSQGSAAPGLHTHRMISVPACVVPIFVFLHVPKTAGTTMRGVFNEMFGAHFHLYTQTRDEVRGDDGKRAFERDDYFDNIMLLAGHFGRFSAVVRAITDRRIVFVSVMRDPVERVVSLYDYIRRMPWHRLHPEVRDRSLAEAFRDSAFRNVCQNDQMRMIFGPKFEAQHEEMLRTNNYVIGTLQHLPKIARVVGNLSGMPPIANIPRFNRIEDISNKIRPVRASAQPDFEDALKAIESANEAERVFFARVDKAMIVRTPDWQQGAGFESPAG